MRADYLLMFGMGFFSGIAGSICVYMVVTSI